MSSCDGDPDETLMKYCDETLVPSPHAAMLNDAMKTCEPLHCGEEAINAINTPPYGGCSLRRK